MNTCVKICTMLTAQPSFFIGDIPIFGNAILAPMDGYSDLPFRSLMRSFGSAISYTEFINAMEVTPRLSPRIIQRIAFLPEEQPIAIQILDNDPERILKASQILTQAQPDIIDINMGCSAKSVSNRGAGAGLLRVPQKIARIFELLSKNLNIPITGKIRLGWDETQRNYLEIARIIEDNGGKCIAVHGRTRQQAYSGMADWDAIATIKQSVKIPVIANGDVKTVADISAIQKHTACDAVMIGRAATTNPWLFKGLDRNQVTPQDIYQTLCKHLDLNLDFYGPSKGLVLFRKYASRYLFTAEMPREIRTELLTCSDPALFKQIAARLIVSSPIAH